MEPHWSFLPRSRALFPLPPSCAWECWLWKTAPKNTLAVISKSETASKFLVSRQQEISEGLNLFRSWEPRSSSLHVASRDKQGYPKLSHIRKWIPAGYPRTQRIKVLLTGTESFRVQKRRFTGRPVRGPNTWCQGLCMSFQQSKSKDHPIPGEMRK